MKKFLSLVLALTMMMSLVTINAGAKNSRTTRIRITMNHRRDFRNWSCRTAIPTQLQAPGTLTRGQPPKIICNLILGPTTAGELHADTAPTRTCPPATPSPATSLTAPRRRSSPATRTAPSVPPLV